MAEPANLFAQQEANRRRSRWLVVSFVLFFAWLGLGGDFLLYEATRHASPLHYHHVFPWFGLILTAIGGAMALVAWASGPEKVLWSTGARQVTAPSSPEQLQLVNVVDEMAIAAGIPKPRVVCDRRSRSERLRDRPRRQRLVHCRHVRAAVDVLSR